MRNIILPVLAAIAFSASAANAQPVEITTCGQTVDNGVLTADLDCSGSPNFAVYLNDGGTLDLAGHTLTGTTYYSSNCGNYLYGGGVRCLGHCTVINGALVGPYPVEPPCFSIGVYADPLQLHSRMTLDNVTISGWGWGATSKFGIVSNSQFVGNYYGLIVTKRSTVTSSTFSGNIMEAAHLTSGEISNSTLDGNANGLYILGKVKLISSSISDNDGWGTSGVKLFALDSSVDGNCLNTTYQYCSDVQGRRRPVMKNSTCGTSFNDITHYDWDVCSQD